MPSSIRPTSVLVIAVLQLVFGGLGVLCYGCSGIGQAVGFSMTGGGATPQEKMQQKMQTNIDEEMEARLPNYKGVKMGILLLELILCFVMIAGGVGLLNMQPIGRRLTIVYGFFSLFMKAVNLAMALLVDLPATKAVMTGFGGEMPREQAAMFGKLMDFIMNASAFGPVCVAIYPVIVLVFMFQPSIVAAFSDNPPVEPTGEQLPDYNDRFRSDPGSPPDERFRS